MRIPEKHHHQQQTAAANAVHELRCLARDGNAEAVAAIRDIALHAIAVLEVIDLGDVPKQSARWPAAYDAILEIRKSNLARVEKLEVGSAIGIRLAGKKRGFTYDEQTGFALDVFRELEAIRLNSSRHIHPADLHPELSTPGVLTEEQLKRDWRNLAAILPELSKASLPLWTAAAVELCREYCMNDWRSFPWPDCVMGKAGKDPSGDGTLRTEESAILGKVSDGLKALIQ